MAHTIAILNQKSGVGKTTTSINLSVGLASKGYRVLVVDIDPQANLTDMLSSSEMSEECCYIDQVLECVGSATATPYASQYERVSFIPSRLNLALTERKILLSASFSQHSRLYRALNRLTGDYDYIIIDCPPIINLLTVNALFCCSEVIIPIKIDKAAEDGFAVTVQNIIETAFSLGLDIDYKVLFTMVSRSKISRYIMNLIREQCDGKDIVTTIRNQEKPITTTEYKKGSVIGTNTGVGNDYDKLVDELINIWKG